MLSSYVSHMCFAAFLGSLIVTAASPTPPICQIVRTGETTGSVTNRYSCAGPCSSGSCAHSDEDIQNELFRCFCNGAWPSGLSCRGNVSWKLDAAGAPTNFVENCWEINCSGDCEPAPQDVETMCRCDGS